MILALGIISAIIVTQAAAIYVLWKENTDLWNTLLKMEQPQAAAIKTPVKREEVEKPPTLHGLDGGKL